MYEKGWKFSVDTVIPVPCNQEVQKYLDLWNSLENYVLQERSLNKLFIKAFPNNTKIEEVLIKASTLNDFYSTNIFSIYPVAKHIINLNIDERLKNGDVTLVPDIANIEINSKKKFFYSFATKYCSHHNPDAFPIYDAYVDKVLMHFKKKDRFDNFIQSDLRDYPTYNIILLKFAEFYGITSYSIKDLDRYLWQLGKEYFPKKY